ncbi:MAG: winged helix-turn-helix domain-containing protein [Actinobacteria bacterium]|nr:winged helix-turn-helix domain-containing protein [Actinomycetota bacterium]
MSDWTFLTNHAYVLVCVARDPGMRLREIGDCVGITERATSRIVTELEEAGYLTRQRVGRRNVYGVNSDAPLRHSLDGDHTVGELLESLVGANGRA